MKVSVVAHPQFVVADIDPRLYGSFIEHLAAQSIRASTSPAMPPPTRTACART